MSWDPERYLTYADERGRPFLDLLARVGAEPPAGRVMDVVDLGCGPGNLTALLSQRWPGARVRGLDSSRAMVDRARADVTGLEREVPEFEVADLRDWAIGDDRVDVVISNAALQWVPGHLDLLPDLVSRVRPGGWIACQVPGNFGEPSHTIRDQLAAEEPYAAHLGGVAVPSSHEPVDYLRALQAAGCEVDAWETTYLHVLTGDDPVFTWVSGTGARPTLEALPDDLRPQFEAELRSRLRAAYPDRGHRCRAAVPAGVRGGEGVVRLHHVQVAIPTGGEDVARRFWVEGLGMSEVAKPADAPLARRALGEVGRRRGAPGGGGAVRSGPQGPPGAAARRRGGAGGCRGPARRPRLRGRPRGP